MTIAAPDFALRSATWSFGRSDSAARSTWTGATRIVGSPWTGKWRAHVELATVQGEKNFQALRSFLARCQGALQTFRLYATAGAQNSNSGVTVSSVASAGTTSLSISGAATPLTDGQMFTVNGQLLCCTAAQSGSTLAFLPPLRKAASVGDVVETARPFALVYMAKSPLGWKTTAGRLFSVAFDEIEAVLEGTGILSSSPALLLEGGSYLLLESGNYLLLE